MVAFETEPCNKKGRMALRPLFLSYFSATRMCVGFAKERRTVLLFLVSLSLVSRFFRFFFCAFAASHNMFVYFNDVYLFWQIHF